MFTNKSLTTENSTSSSTNQFASQSTNAPTPGHNSERSSPAFKISNLVERGDRGLEKEAMSSSLQHESSFPTHPNRTYSHLPTPQSPNNFGNYVLGVPYAPESPVPNSSHSHLTPSTGSRPIMTRRTTEETRLVVQPMSQQTVTPESSPYARTASRYNNSATPQYNHPTSRTETATPRGTSSFVKLETSTSANTLAPAHRISSPVSSPSEERSSRLSSPFMAKLSIADQTSKTRTPIRSRPQSYTPEMRPMQVDDVFSPPGMSESSRTNPSLLSSVSTPPVSPPPQTPRPAAGGEMERIRQAMVQDRLAHFQDAETRRPEYLKRTKRSLSEADPMALAEDENIRERERDGVVGIMESPNKGRRLKLFQETSEESFEESLMAGGYGRYRTADWVRQPQPLMLTTPGPAGPSNVVSALEQAEEVPLTEKELRKRRRLAAFRERTIQDGPVTKLHPVELEGRGRVLLDVPAEEDSNMLAEPTPTKKKGGGRRKKKSGELTVREKKALAIAAAAGGELLEKPNWPDAEFPWRLRAEERAEEVKAEGAEKLKWIEKFLDRESDDEDEDEVMAEQEGGQERWGIYEDEGNQLPPTRRGRGKMVPLSAHTSGEGSQFKRKSAFFPSDPADARAALLSKKSVRTLSYRQQRRQRRAEDESDEEIVCVCNGRDDGRELVQCDGCETWYHLQCIGIKDISQLGKEEDPWFCRDCDSARRPPISEPELSSEPTFVPTNDEPRLSRSYDPPFFQPPSLQDSPMAWDQSRMPHTPTRSRQSEYNQEFSSGSSWVDSSRHGPSTPQQPMQSARVYTYNTPGFDTYNHDYDEVPFDPTSTPSRGIKLTAPFATPKNNVWSTRANGLFQTPAKGAAGRGPANKTFGGPGTLASALDDGGGGSSAYERMYPDEESPIRRVRSSEGPKARRIMDSPLASRSMGVMPQNLLEESPIMRFRNGERRQDFGHSSFHEGR